MVCAPGDLVEVRGICWSYDRPPHERFPETVKLLPRGATAIFIEEARHPNGQRATRILHESALMWVDFVMLGPCEVTDETG